MYTDCVYVDGNIEITNFDPNHDNENEGTINEYALSEKKNTKYDFSFLDNIQEITGYLLIHNTYIESLKFKSLRVIRGWNLFFNKYSIYVEDNHLLETLNLTLLQGEDI
jgi:hypothetical protein